VYLYNKPDAYGYQ
jgi:hypothetical protein